MSKLIQMLDKCPVCEHKLERILDFPKIFVVEFNRKVFPDLIGSDRGSFWEDTQENLEMLEGATSPEFIARLKSSLGESMPFKPSRMRERDYRGGYIYYKDQKGGKSGYVQLANVTAPVRGALQLPEVENYLKGLEAVVGMEITPEQVRTPTIKGHLGYNDFKISLMEIEQQNGHNVCEIRLRGELWDLGPYEFPLVDTNIATLVYDGRMNK